MIDAHLPHLIEWLPAPRAQTENSEFTTPALKKVASDKVCNELIRSSQYFKMLQALLYISFNHLKAQFKCLTQ